jgi:hypothetical protein
MDKIWGPLLMVATSAYALRCFGSVVRAKRSLEDGLIVVGLVLFIALQCVEIGASVMVIKSTAMLSYVVDALTSLVISTVLCALAVVVRESKPIVTRFPLALTFLPFLLVPAHLIVRDTFVLKDMLYGIYELGAILIAFLIFGLKSFTDFRYRYILLGTIPLAISLGVNWFAQPSFPIQGTTWVLMGISLIVIPRTYKNIQLNRHDSDNW